MFPCHKSLIVTAYLVLGCGNTQNDDVIIRHRVPVRNASAQECEIQLSFFILRPTMLILSAGDTYQINIIKPTNMF